MYDLYYGALATAKWLVFYKKLIEAYPYAFYALTGDTPSGFAAVLSKLGPSCYSFLWGLLLWGLIIALFCGAYNYREPIFGKNSPGPGARG